MAVSSRFLRLTFHPKETRDRHEWLLELAGPPVSLGIRDKTQIATLQTRQKELRETLEHQRTHGGGELELEVVDLLNDVAAEEPWGVLGSETQISHILWARFKEGPKLLTDKLGTSGVGIMSPCTFEELVRFREENVPCLGATRAVAQRRAWAYHRCYHLAPCHIRSVKSKARVAHK